MRFTSRVMSGEILRRHDAGHFGYNVKTVVIKILEVDQFLATGVDW